MYKTEFLNLYNCVSVGQHMFLLNSSSFHPSEVKEQCLVAKKSDARSAIKLRKSYNYRE